MRVRKVVALGAALTLTAVVSACSSGSDSGSGSQTVNWWTWDDKQAAAYEVCATDFEKANPGVTVKISQYAVADYFTKLTAGFVAGNAPDAFQDSVTYFQEYADQNQLLALDDFIEEGQLRPVPLLRRRGLVEVHRRQAVRPAAGLGRDRHLLQRRHAHRGGLHQAGRRHAQLEPRRRRHRRQDDRPPDSGHQGPPRRPARLRQEPRQDVRLRSDSGQGLPGRHHLELLRLHHRLAAEQQAELAHHPELRRPAVREDDGLGPFPGGQGVRAGRSGRSPTASRTSTCSPPARSPWRPAAPGRRPPSPRSRASRSASRPPCSAPTARPAPCSSNSNGNNIWAGTKNPDLAWKWVSYMGSEACQSKASLTGTFFPSIPASMDASAKALKAEGVDLSVFTDMLNEQGPLPGPEPHATVRPCRPRSSRCSRRTSPVRRTTASSRTCRARARPYSPRNDTPTPSALRGRTKAPVAHLRRPGPL